MLNLGLYMIAAYTPFIYLSEIQDFYILKFGYIGDEPFKDIKAFLTYALNPRMETKGKVALFIDASIDMGL